MSRVAGAVTEQVRVVAAESYCITTASYADLWMELPHSKNMIRDKIGKCHLTLHSYSD